MSVRKEVFWLRPKLMDDLVADCTRYSEEVDEDESSAHIFLVNPGRPSLVGETLPRMSLEVFASMEVK